MTKPVGYFVASPAIDLLTYKYGSYLEKLTRPQLLLLLLVVVERSFGSRLYTSEDSQQVELASCLVDDACAKSEDVALGLLEAIVSQLRYPLEVAPSVEVAGMQIEVSTPSKVCPRCQGRKLVTSGYTCPVDGWQATLKPCPDCSSAPNEKATDS